MLQDETFYEVLNLSEDASAEELKRAYRSLIKLWHPDLNPDKPDAAEVTQKIIEAYGILSDPLKRSQYDEYLSLVRQKTNNTYAGPGESEPDSSGTYSAWQDAFNGQPHKFDEEGYKEYVKNKKSIFEKEGKLSKGFIVILMLIPVFSILLLNSEKTGKTILPLILGCVGIAGACFEIFRRNNAAREEREARLGGIDSTAEADKWFDVWLYPGMPFTDCRKAFFAFSVRADKHILSRFNMLSDEEKKEYADIIELLEECIRYREKRG